MFRNYLKTAWRHMQRHRLFTGLNIVGLAAGLFCSILILLWVKEEYSYDRFNPGADRIFRLVATLPTVPQPLANVPTAFWASIKTQIPQAKNATRLYPTMRLIRSGSRRFDEQHVFYADTNFLAVFNYPLLRGDFSTVLVPPHGVVLTAATAVKYFGGIDKAMGSVVFDETDSVPRQVTGILADPPGNSHLQFDLLLPVSDLDRRMDETQTWRYFDSFMYLQLADGVSPDAATMHAIADRLDGLRNRAIAGTPAVPASLTLQPLTDVHLRSHFKNDVDGQGNIEYVRIFSMAAVFILLIACVNFMNLATALSGTRAKEVGLRKTVGALRWQLIGQFMGESMLLALLSLVLALVLVFFALPFFNALSGKTLVLDLFNFGVSGPMLGIALCAGLLAGAYPAFYLSSFNVIEVLKGRLKLGGRTSFLRNGLVIGQFSIAVILMIGTVVVYQQLRYLHDRDLGFDRQHLLYMRQPPSAVGVDGTAVAAVLRRMASVVDVTTAWELPTEFHMSSMLTWRGKDKSTLVTATRMGVDEHYVRTMGMTMAAGRFFSATDSADDRVYVINETAARAMGVTPASSIGKLITINGKEGAVAGVVRDFNFKPVYQAIEPLVMKRRDNGDYMLIRVSGDDVAVTLTAIRDRFHKDYPDMPFSYGFLDEDLDRLYQSEVRMGVLFRVFSALAILLSCMGLFGLATFATRRRTREIGVRKVLGAGEFSLLVLLAKEFLGLVGLSLLVAYPVAWYAMHVWLRSFFYQVAISGWVFLAAGVAALVIAFVTVGWQTFRAAKASPVKALGAE